MLLGSAAALVAVIAAVLEAEVVVLAVEGIGAVEAHLREATRQLQRLLAAAHRRWRHGATTAGRRERVPVVVGGRRHCAAGAGVLRGLDGAAIAIVAVEGQCGGLPI